MVIILLEVFKVTCPYCKLDVYIIDDESIYNLNRINEFLYACDFCGNKFKTYYDGVDIATTKIHKDKRTTDILKGDDNMIDKNTIFEIVYEVIKYNMDWSFGEGDKFSHFVNGVITMAEELIEKIEPKTEETEK